MNQDQLREALEANGCERLKDFYNVGPVQRAAVESFVAALTATGLNKVPIDPENQPNQYGVEFLMRGPKMAFKVGNQTFALDYEPDEIGDFEFMRDMLIHAFSTFTPDVNISFLSNLNQSNTKSAINQAVDRFLGWKLPQDFSPDCGISFTPLGHPNGWPGGTNLLNANQARQMLEYILAVGEQPATSKPEPQAQAGEPEVVAWIGVAPRDGRINLVVDKPSPTPMRAFNFQPLIYLHLYREAMQEHLDWLEVVKQQRDHFASEASELREAIAKKDAALKACVDAIYGFIENVDAPPDGNCSCHISPPCSDCVDHSCLREAFANGRAAITQGQDALK